MSFIDQKPFLITKELLEAFKRKRRSWCCQLCGHPFAEGFTARWIYTAGHPVSNFFVCQQCDSGDVLKKGVVSFQTAVSLARQWDIYGPDWQKDLQ